VNPHSLGNGQGNRALDGARFLQKGAAHGVQGLDFRAYIGADFAGAVGNFGVYGEATLALPGTVAGGTGPDDFKKVHSGI
jgi:hypothetical protein